MNSSTNEMRYSVEVDRYSISSICNLFFQSCLLTQNLSPDNLSDTLNRLISVNPYFKTPLKYLKSNDIVALLGKGKITHCLNYHSIEPELVYATVLDLVIKAARDEDDKCSSPPNSNAEGPSMRALLSPSVASFMIASVLYHIFHKDTASGVHISSRNLAFLNILNSFIAPKVATAGAPGGGSPIKAPLSAEDVVDFKTVWEELRVKISLGIIQSSSYSSHNYLKAALTSTAANVSEPTDASNDSATAPDAAQGEGAAISNVQSAAGATASDVSTPAPSQGAETDPWGENSKEETWEESVEIYSEVNPLINLTDEDAANFLMERLVESERQLKLFVKILRKATREEVWKLVLDSESAVLNLTEEAVTDSGIVRTVGGVFFRLWKRCEKHSDIEKKVAMAKACIQVNNLSSQLTSKQVIAKALESMNNSVAVMAGNAPPAPPPLWKWEGNWVDLRLYQSQCVATVWVPNSYSSFVVNAPTGSGKSFIMMELMGRVMQEKQSSGRGGAKLLLVTPTVPLSDQFTILLRANSRIVRNFAPIIVASNSASPLPANTWLELMRSPMHVVVIGTAKSILNILETLAERANQSVLHELRMGRDGTGGGNGHDALARGEPSALYQRQAMADGLAGEPCGGSSGSSWLGSGLRAGAAVGGSAGNEEVGLGAGELGTRKHRRIEVDPMLADPLSVIDALFFDEAHHCRKDDPYNGIMTYFREGSCTRIYGFTASIASGQDANQVESNSRAVLKRLNNACFYALVSGHSMAPPSSAPSDPAAAREGLNSTGTKVAPASLGPLPPSAAPTNGGTTNGPSRTNAPLDDLGLSDHISKVVERVEPIAFRSRDLQVTGSLTIALWDVLTMLSNEMTIIRRRLMLPPTHPESLANGLTQREFVKRGPEELASELYKALSLNPINQLVMMAEAQAFLPNSALPMLRGAERNTHLEMIRTAEMKARTSIFNRSVSLSPEDARARLQGMLQEGLEVNAVGTLMSTEEAAAAGAAAAAPFSPKALLVLERLGVVSIASQKEALTVADKVVTAAIDVATATNAFDLLTIGSVARAVLRSFETLGVVGCEAALMFLSRRLAFALVSSSHVKLEMSELTPFVFRDEIDAANEARGDAIVRSPVNDVLAPKVVPSSSLLESALRGEALQIDPTAFIRRRTEANAPPSFASAFVSGNGKPDSAESSAQAPASSSLPVSDFSALLSAAAKSMKLPSRPPTSKMQQLLNQLLSRESVYLSIFLDDPVVARELFVAATTTVLKNGREEGQASSSGDPPLADAPRSAIVPRSVAAASGDVPIEPFPKLAALRALLRCRLAAPEARDDFHCIIFASRRQAVFAITDFLRSDSALRDVEVLEFLGHSVQNSDTTRHAFSGSIRERWEYGMGGHEQYDVIQVFKMYGRKILVSTSAAEEGIDIPSCNLVIRYTPAMSGIQRIQSRGRARSLASEFITLIQIGSSDELWHHNGELEERELNRFILQNMTCDETWVPDYEDPRGANDRGLVAGGANGDLERQLDQLDDLYDMMEV